MEEDKKMKYAKGVGLVITKAELETNPINPEQIMKIRFKTTMGDITWKPKLRKSVYQGGLEVISKVSMKINEIPDKLKEIGEMLSEHGNLKAIVNYTIMDTITDGKEVTYRFITSEKTFNEWELIPYDAKEEEIECNDCLDK